MKMIHLPLIPLAIGLVLIVLSLAWPSAVGSSGWSEEEAREWSAASAEMHSLLHNHGHAPGEAEATSRDHESPALKAARERYAKADAGLQKARSFRFGVAAVLKWSGIVLLVAGTICWWVIQRTGAGE